MCDCLRFALIGAMAKFQGTSFKNLPDAGKQEELEAWVRRLHGELKGCRKSITIFQLVVLVLGVIIGLGLGGMR